MSIFWRWFLYGEMQLFSLDRRQLRSVFSGILKVGISSHRWRPKNRVDIYQFHKELFISQLQRVGVGPPGALAKKSRHGGLDIVQLQSDTKNHQHLPSSFLKNLSHVHFGLSFLLYLRYSKRGDTVECRNGYRIRFADLYCNQSHELIWKKWN